MGLNWPVHATPIDHFFGPWSSCARLWHFHFSHLCWKIEPRNIQLISRLNSEIPRGRAFLGEYTDLPSFIYFMRAMPLPRLQVEKVIWIIISIFRRRIMRCVFCWFKSPLWFLFKQIDMNSENGAASATGSPRPSQQSATAKRPTQANAALRGCRREKEESCSN